MLVMGFSLGKKACMEVAARLRHAGPIRHANRIKLLAECGAGVIDAERHGEVRDYDTRPRAM